MNYEPRMKITATFRVRQEDRVVLDSSHDFRISEEEFDTFDYQSKLEEIYAFDGETIEILHWTDEDLEVFYP